VNEFLIAMGLCGWFVALYFFLEALTWRDRANQWEALAYRWEMMWASQYEQTMAAIDKSNAVLSTMERRGDRLQ
jgi:hypothetical protein